MKEMVTTATRNRKTDGKDMVTLRIEYPDDWSAAFHQGRDAFEQEAKMAMAVKLFEMGKLTSGQAAKLAGISRVQFLMDCARFGVPSVTWDKDEIEAEFGRLS